jgi:long-chain acyl-CoA synthetase
MSMGARLVLFPRFDPDMVLAVTKKHPATFLPLVPPIADRLLKASLEKGVPLTGTDIAISGAMALPHDLCRSCPLRRGAAIPDVWADDRRKARRRVAR